MFIRLSCGITYITIFVEYVHDDYLFRSECYFQYDEILLPHFGMLCVLSSVAKGVKFWPHITTLNLKICQNPS